MKKNDKKLIYFLIILIISLSSILLYKINKSEKDLYNETYEEADKILENINNINIYDNIPNQENNNNIIATSEKKSQDSQIKSDRIDSFIKISKLGIFSPVVKETSMTNLKVSPTKLWGCEPNTVGNYCIIGHNWKNDEQFSKINTLQIGDTAELTTTNGVTLKYSLYEKYNVNEKDLSFTSQKTNGSKELTLVTCC